MKKVIRILIYLFIGILLAMVVLPFVFKDKILLAVKETIEDQVNAEVEFSDVDISLFRSFPKVSVKVKDVDVKGVDAFDGVQLMKADAFAFDLSLTPLFNTEVEPEIFYVGLENPVLSIIVNKDGEANYDIVKESDTESEGFFTPLRKYEIINGQISYTDKVTDFKFILDKMDHSGSGTLADDIFDLTTKTKAREVTVEMEGTKYLNKAPVDLEAMVNVDLPNSKYTLKDNVLNINGLNARGDGMIQLKGDDILIDAKFNSLGESFSNFLALVPYLPNLDKVKTSGTASVYATVKGTYNGDRPAYPAFDLKIDVANGNLKYPNLPKSISEVVGSILIKSTRADMGDLIINIPNFDMKVGDDPLSGNLLVENGTSNPKAKGSLKGKLDLSGLQEVVEMQGLQSINGQMESDITFDVAMDDVENENYQNIDASGSFQIANFKAKMEGQPEISIASGEAQLAPEVCTITTQDFQVGSSKMDLSGRIENPISILHSEVDVKGNLKVKASELNLDEWVSEEEVQSESVDFTSEAEFDLSKYEKSSFDLDVDVDKVVYQDYDIKAFKAKGKLGPQRVDITNMSTVVNKSDIKVEGTLINPIDYLFGSETLRGDITIASRKMNLNTLMPTSESAAPAQESTILVPENMVLNINSTLGEVIYGDMTLKNVLGVVKVGNQVVDLEGVKANLLGGNVVLNGLYDTKVEKPSFDMKIDLNQLRFEDAYKQFVTVQKLAPIANYLSGLFNTTLVLSGRLGDDMTPEFSSFNASGVIETLNGFVRNLKPLDQVSQKLGVTELSKFNLERTKNWFDINNGVVELKPFEKEIEDIKLNIAGTHSLEQDMDYTILADIPRSKLKSSVVGSTVDKGLSWLESEARKKGVNIDQGDFIKLKINVGGTITKPKISIVPLGSGGKSIKDEVEAEIKDQIDVVKDSVTTVVKNTTDKVKDSINTRVNEELDKAKDKAKDKADEVITDVTDKVKDKVGSKIDTLIGGAVSDTLIDKASDILKDKTGTSVDDLKDKLEGWNPFKKKKKKGN